MTDLSKLETKTLSEKGAKLYFIAPDGKETTLFMEVLGPDSKMAINKINEAVLEIVNNPKEETDEKPVQDMSTLLESQEKYLEGLLERVIGWGDHLECEDENPKKGEIISTVQWGEEALKFNKKNLTKVLTACPWMKEQIQAFMGKRANFLQA